MKNGKQSPIEQSVFAALSEETINEMEMECAQGGEKGANNCKGGNCIAGCGVQTTPTVEVYY